MALSPGTRVGPYEITGLLGAGGMGEVYRARDSKLNRDVALKVPPDAFATNAERLMRFDREAQLLAALNHPHIAHIYGVVDSDGGACPIAIVMEHVDGVTLAGRIAQGRVSIREALSIARQIAAALEAAHDRGIVHRDLKPSNIKLSSDGSIKVLDFGVAKLLTEADLDPLSAAEAPTATALATRQGAFLGTIPYMSPEQARGLPVDRRTDVWAFGCVLFELLTGRVAFGGATIPDTVAAILERDPDWTLLPPGTPPAVVRLLRRCLQKDLKLRLRDCGDLRLDIDEMLSTDVAGHSIVGVSLGPRRTVWITGAIVLAGAVMALLATFSPLTSSRAIAPIRLSIPVPGTITPQSAPALSPDGRQLAFVTTSASGQSMLWLRAFDSVDARELPGTANAAHPFWSPDGRSLAFMSEGKLKKVAAAGGPVQVLADGALRAGGTWGANDQIVFVTSSGQLASVPGNGGAVSVMPLPRSLSPGWPHFLPDGRHFLFLDNGRPGNRTIYVAQLGSIEIKAVLKNDFRAVYDAAGYLVFARDENLMAQPFDLNRHETTGDPVIVADSVWGARGAGQASISAVGPVLAYVNASLWNSQLAWFDRSGKPLGTLSAPDRYQGQDPQISPGDRRIAIGRNFRDIWLLNASDGSGSRFTFSPGTSGPPLWSGDGSRVAYLVAAEGGRSRIVAKRIDTGAEDVLFETPGLLVLQDWSADGNHIVYYTFAAGGGLDLWILPLAGDRTPFLYLHNGFNCNQAQISPNGKWLAYTCNETGGDEVYVDSFPRRGSKHQISNGGVMPRWRKDGKELFYLSTSQFFMAVPVESADSTFFTSSPKPLFRTSVIVQGSQSIGFPISYAVTGDGARFVVNDRPQDPGPPIDIVLNWTGVLKK
jgi:eukaryotic-like serine/threonine-protein kinase